MKRGFSLIEVNLAVLLVGVALLGLMALFPVGLKESERNVMDTHEAMFVDHVFNQLHGNAAKLDLSVWTDADAFERKVTEGIYPLDMGGSPRMSETEVGGGVKFPELANDTNDVQRHIRYELTIENVYDNRDHRKACRLRVVSGRLGDFTGLGKDYYTELIYLRN